MTDPAAPDFPPQVWRKLDSPCDAFERAWMRGERPALEPHLEGVDEQLRPYLRDELVRVELEWRCRRGEQPTEAEYRARFPNCAANFELWLAEARESSGQLHEAATGAPPPLSTETRAGPPILAQVETVTVRPLLRVLGEYDLLERLGGGGMGEVYRARHRRLDKLVAVKVLTSRRAPTAEATARFLREMKAIGQAEHPHVVEALDAGECDGVVFLVMKLVEGVDLHRLVAERGPLPVSEACALARQAAAGLAYLHGRGLVHRDVKPSNLIRTGDGSVKILDLGLARLRAGVDGEMTDTGVMMGTPDYLAPEQAQDAGAVDARADLYALGATLFFLLSGRAPFVHRVGLLEKLYAHATEAPPDLTALRPEVPPALAELVGRLMAKRPEDRPGSAGEVEVALTPSSMANGRVPQPPAVPAFRRHDRSRLVTCLVLGGVVLLAMLAVLANRPGNPKASDPADDPVAVRPQGAPVDLVSGTPAPPLTIKPLRVRHYQAVGDKAIHRGVIGDGTFSTRFGDSVTVTVELSEPAYFFLIGFNFDGKEQLLWPADGPGAAAESRAPEQLAGFHFPPGGRRLYLDDDPRGGLQVFAVVASRRPLPCWQEWRSARLGVAWRSLPAGESVWQANAKGVYPALPGLLPDRGTVKDVPGAPPLAELARALTRDGGEAVEAVAFPVRAKEGRR